MTAIEVSDECCARKRGGENAKLEWLRAAAKQGFDAIEKGDYTALKSDEEINRFVRQIHDEVKAELAAERRIG